MFAPSFSMDLARLAGVPLAYLPIMSAGFALSAQGRLQIDNYNKGLLTLSLVFSIYTFITGLIINDFSFVNFTYWVVWPFNFLIFFAAMRLFTTASNIQSTTLLKSISFILTLGCAVGIARFVFGISGDSNFMPVVNRNGTVIFVVMVLPLLFGLHSRREISTSFFGASLSIIFVALILMTSRSGLIGALVAVSVYYIRFNIQSLLKFGLILSVMGIFLMTEIGDVAIQRMDAGLASTQKYTSGDEFDADEKDFNRVQLMTAAILVIEKNFLLGSGLGLENYRKKLREVSNYHKESKAHNFYLSYMAELGLLGLSALIIFFSLVFQKLIGLRSIYPEFRTSFIVIAVMMTMNEYILLPEIWFFFGVLVGISIRLKRDPRFS